MGNKEAKKFYEGDSETNNPYYFQYGDEKIPAYYFAGVTNLRLSSMIHELEQDKELPEEERVYVHEEWDKRIALTRAAVTVARYDAEMSPLARGLERLPSEEEQAAAQSLVDLATILLMSPTEEGEEMRQQWTDRLRFIPDYLKDPNIYTQGKISKPL